MVDDDIAAIRRRPGMYVGDTRDGSGLHHLLWELLGNAIDEHLAGGAARVEITIRGRAVTVEDDGRGIPITPTRSPRGERPALELLLTVLRADVRRERGEPHVHIGDDIRGVGLAAVNALCEELRVETTRAGRRYAITCARGRVASPLRELGPAARPGTRVTFTPDPEVFGDGSLELARVHARARELSYLNPRALLIVNGEELRAPGGLRDAVSARARARTGDPPPILHARGDLGGVAVELALCWIDASEHDPEVISYVSQFPTRDGGTHVRGLWAGLRQALVRRVPTIRGLSTDRFRAAAGRGLIASVHADLYAPRFGSPTKDRLESPEARAAVRAALVPALETWLEDHARVLASLRARLDAA
ncbi:MAG: hypothetical protein H6713_06670 [Myxococcales bacterium]|nr:hypothetical protein [Myxococcales bacterium]